MQQTFKAFLVEASYNWAINPREWNDIKSNNSVTKDTLTGIPSMATSKLWGKRDPKPSDKFAFEPEQRKFTIRYLGNYYLVDLGNPGSNHRNFKKIVSGSRLGSNEERTQSASNPKEWRKIQNQVTTDEVKELKVYSADSLWTEGGRAKPDSPFKSTPPEKKFVAKIANARYLITLSGNNRKIQRVNPGTVGILGSTSRRK